MRFLGEGWANPVTGDYLDWTAKTKVDAEAIHGIILSAANGAFERAVQQLLNMVVSVTFPNNPDSYMRGPSTGRYRPSKKAVKKLQDRIIKDLGPALDAVPGADGKPVLKGPNGIGGGAAMPVVVERKWRGRTGRKLNRPDRVLNENDLLRFLESETYRWGKRHTVHRVVKPAVRRTRDGWVWTTKAAWKRVTKELSLEAGNFAFGWNELGKLVRSRAVSSATLSNGRYQDSSSGFAKMVFNEARKTMSLESVNANAPVPGKGDFVKGADYRAQRILDNMLESAWEKALWNAFGQINIKNLKKLKSVQDFDGVEFFWD